MLEEVSTERDARMWTSRYALLSPIGRGGAGDVFRARDLHTDRIVAVKILRAIHLANVEVRERFLREGRILARIDSPYVCRVLDSGTNHDVPYLVVDFIEGAALDALVKRGRRLPLERVASIVDDVLQGLAVAHDAGVIHRDLKPSNILIVADGHAKLIDFGISKLMLAAEPSLTSTSAVLGSPAFMAPEQLAGAARVDERADLYAVGLVAFRLLAGTLPFPTTVHAQLLAMKRGYPAPSLAERTGEDWPASLEGFLARMLERSPDARPESARAALAAWRTSCAAAIDALGAPRTEREPEADPGEDDETPVLSRRP